MNIIKKLVQNRKPPKTPIWLMRQAGRYLPEYMEIRKNAGSFLNMCYTKEVAAKITMQPIERFDFDAAIIFSDILLIPDALGSDLKFLEGEGPVLSTIENHEDIKKLTTQNITKKLEPVYEAISLVKSKLNKEKSLIGFAGAPWTLLAYMVDGNSHDNFIKSRVFIEDKKELANELIDILIESISIHLINQIEAGADVVQIFDSWAGALTEHNYHRFVIEPTQKIVSKIKAKYKDIPIIGFPRGSSFMYEDYVKETDVDIISIDQQVPLKWAEIKLKEHAIIQGNLDPACLFCNKDVISSRVEDLKNNLGQGEFIFNLGHGILPKTPIENVEHLIKEVRNN